MAPTNESTSAVDAWLNENGLQATVLSAAGDWLSVQLPVSTANDLLDADFSIFTHAATGKQAVRTLAYSVPTDLVNHVALVHPTISFPNPYGYVPITNFSSSGLIPEADTGPCDVNSITPTCLQWLYGIPTTPATSKENNLAVTGYVEEWPSVADLSAFLAKYRPDIDSATSWTLVTLDNGSDPQGTYDAGLEANLDTQYTIGLATDVPVTFISAGDSFDPTDNEFAQTVLDTALYMLALPSPPQVMTTSYGDDEEHISQNLAIALCATYAGLSARGVSVLFASGDGGVSGLHFQECTTFLPTFPSGCPFLTSVGGTVNIPEEAVYFSSGGFSTFFDRPPYQEIAVAEYLAYVGDTNAGLYNPSGRAFPDVAAYSVAFDIVIDGYYSGVDGTSCASPTFASVISLLNDELISAGRPVLGFLNPWLYSAAWALNDITVGNNYACSDFTTGFNATTGWDAVTGLGTPNYAKLKAALGL